MTDNVNFFAPPREVRATELRLRSLRRRSHDASRRNGEPFTNLELAALGAAVFFAVLALGVFGLPGR